MTITVNRLKKKTWNLKSYEDRDCVNCSKFSTDRFCYPSGRCKQYDVGCGLGNYCEKFKQNKRLLQSF